MLFCRCMRACELHPETCDFGVDLRQLPLAGIAPERAHGPERVDPGGLWGFLHLSLDVWVDLRGRRRQFSACHGSLPPRVLPPAESSQYVFLLLVSEQAGSLRDRLRRTKPHPPSHWCYAKAEGERLPPCRITGSSDTLRRASACLLVIERSSIPDFPRASLRLTRRHDVTSTAWPTQRAPKRIT